MTRRRTAWLAVVLLAAGCSADPGNEEPAAEPGGGETAAVAAPDAGADPVDPDDPALDAAVDEPREDSYYPRVGDPSVDALHYQLDLGWTPRTRRLEGAETLTFRATTTAESFRLDLAAVLAVDSLLLDGEEVAHREDGKDLVVEAPVTADSRHVLELRYSGVPEPVAAPTTRGDFSTTGWTTTDDGGAWTMQEPYGAYTWYAVNDHPSDKAFYDFTLSTPAPFVGVANGQLTSREVVDGRTVTAWHLDAPAASYLVTVALGDLRMTRARSESGVPLTYWTPRGDPQARRRVQRTAGALTWAEERLGPYPFDSLGVVVVDSRSGMETQAMITLGNTDYTLSPEVLVHEVVHQWWGNTVTPEDWSDLWMSEGMTMYLQYLWQAEQYDASVEELMADWAAYQGDSRREAGPPAAYDPTRFGEGNVYHLPAMMWHVVRERIGDEAFWRLVREWPAGQDDGHASYDEITAWWSERSGEDLQPLFDAWLLGEDSPPFP